MASVEKLPSGRYRGVFYLAERPGEKPRKRRVSGTFTHKKAARDAAIEAEGRSISDPQHDPAHGRMSWAAWEQVWLPSVALTPRSKARTATIARVHLRPAWGSVPLVEIAHLDVQVWVNSLVEAGSAPATAKRIGYTLSASLKAALRAGLIRANPCTGIVMPTSPSAPERYLADAEVDRLFYRIGGRYRVLVAILLEAGLRLSEAIGLHWQCVDLETGTVRVVGQWDPEVKRVVAYTKGKAARTVPLTDDLVERLRKWAKTSPPGASCGLEHEGGAPCRSSLVVPAPRGGPIDAHNFHARTWSKAIKASGIGRCRPHDLRHTWASRLVTGGASLERLQAWGGWESFTMVQRYAHFMREDHDAYREAMARPRGAPTLRVVE